MAYEPARYFTGLTPAERAQRKRRMARGRALPASDPRAYRPFKTDKGKRTKPSKYTQKFQKLFPEAKSLEQKAKVTGVPLRIVKKVYDRGLAAWRTGHRPGASQQAWGHARVASFLTRGKTFYTTDKDLALEAVKKMTPKNIKAWLDR